MLFGGAQLDSPHEQLVLHETVSCYQLQCSRNFWTTRVVCGNNLVMIFARLTVDPGFLVVRSSQAEKRMVVDDQRG